MSRPPVHILKFVCVQVYRRLFCFEIVVRCGFITVWSEVTLVNESDPGGWIPAAITRTMSAKLLPTTVEKFSAQIMTH